MSPFGSIGTSHIIVAVVRDTYGKLTFDGCPGTIGKNINIY